ncbi:MAG: hypothetical protein Q9222_005391 [Ikaeria aurantiellina]
MRLPEDTSASHHPFTHFTFLAIDTECFDPTVRLPEIPGGSQFCTDSKFTVLVCSDAPDLYENDTEPRLKTLRLPIMAALGHLEALEYLLTTPSEVHRVVFEDPNTDCIKLLPPAAFIPVPPFTGDEDQEYRLGSAAQMRERKRQGLRIAEEAERENGVQVNG